MTLSLRGITKYGLLTGSQHLYGPEAIEQVGAHSREIAAALDDAAAALIPQSSVRCLKAAIFNLSQGQGARAWLTLKWIVFKPVLTTAEEIHGMARAVCGEQR